MTYTYVANSPLVGQITFAHGTTRMATTNHFDFLNRLQSVSNVPAADSTVSFNYQYNSANQRTAVTNADNSFWLCQYDTLGQVISARKYWSDGTPVAGQQFTYGFDDIGNRTAAASGGDASGNNLRSQSYTADALNEYSSRALPGYVSQLGWANPQAHVLTVADNGLWSDPPRKGGYFASELAVNNAAALWLSVTNSAVLAGTTDFVSRVNGHVFVPPATENIGYDADGNLTSDGRWNYTWDGESQA